MKKQAFTIKEASYITGISKSKLYEEISSGKLIARKICSRTVILEKDLENYLSSLPEFLVKREIQS